MTDAMGEAPKGAFFDATEAELEAGQLLNAMELFRRRMGESALSVSAQEQLLPITQRIADVALGLHEHTSQLEEKERFGDEESYWNLFRFLCSEGKRGQVRSLDEIWSHLALSFDMGSESHESLQVTIEEWCNDFIVDVEKKFRVKGRVEPIGRGYAFIEDFPPVSQPKKQPSKPKTKTVPTPVLDPESTQKDERAHIDKFAIVSTLQSLISVEQPFLKQSEVVKTIMRNLDDIQYDEVLEEINKLASMGAIYKFKPKKNSASYLCLEKKVAEANMDDNTSTQAKRKTAEQLSDFNIYLSSTVVTSVYEQINHAQEMISTGSLTNSINLQRSAAKENRVATRDINRIARMLAELGVLRVDRGAALRGKGKARSKGKSQEVLRVGIADQEMKDKLKDIIASDSLRDFLNKMLQGRQ